MNEIMRNLKNNYFLIIILSSISLFFSCKNNHKIPSNNDQNVGFKVIATDSIKFGSSDQICDIRKTIDGNYRMFIYAYEENDIPFRLNQFMINLSKEGKEISNQKVSFKPPLCDYIELEYEFYTITTLSVTMGKDYSHDYLSKYDKDWNLIWKKELKTEIYPAGSSFLLFKNNELTLITDNYNRKEKYYGMSIQKFDLDGEKLSDDFYQEYNGPRIILKNLGAYFLFTTVSNKTDSVVLIKKELNGPIIWKKNFSSSFAPNQIFETRDYSFILYGTYYKGNGEADLHIYKIDKNGNELWLKSIDKSYYDQAGQLIEYRNSFVFSSSVTPLRNNGQYPYLFELDNTGNLVCEKQFDFKVASSSSTYLINNNDTITMISEKWTGERIEYLIRINRLIKDNNLNY